MKNIHQVRTDFNSPVRFEILTAVNITSHPFLRKIIFLTSSPVSSTPPIKGHYFPLAPSQPLFPICVPSFSRLPYSSTMKMEVEVPQKQ
jgi:hypothetical protein